MVNATALTLSPLGSLSQSEGQSPYDLAYLQRIHRHLFGDVYDWAGELCTVDISKGGTHFCNVTRIEAESTKLFKRVASTGWFEAMACPDLVIAAAELYGDLNIIHPFREGSGRSRRILFEHLIIYQVDWWGVGEAEWIQANIDSVVCDYRAMTFLFERCIGDPIA